MPDYLWDCHVCGGKQCMTSSHEFEGVPAGVCECSKCGMKGLACPQARGVTGAPGQVGVPKFKVVKECNILEAYQFTTENPHVYKGVKGPLPSSCLFEVETKDGHRIVNDGDWITEDMDGNFNVIPKNIFDKFYKKI